MLIDHADRFKSDVSVGLGINLPGSTRVGGCNNLQRGTRFDLEQLRRSKKISVSFKFDEGIPCLSARIYELVVGIHDESISRNVATRVVGSIPACNSRVGINPDADVIAIHKFVSSVSLVTSN